MSPCLLVSTAYFLFWKVISCTTNTHKQEKAITADIISHLHDALLLNQHKQNQKASKVCACVCVCVCLCVRACVCCALALARSLNASHFPFDSPARQNTVVSFCTKPPPQHNKRASKPLVLHARILVDFPSRGAFLRSLGALPFLPNAY